MDFLDTSITQAPKPENNNVTLKVLTSQALDANAS